MNRINDDNYIIRDSRNYTDFKLKTFSGYKKNEVVKVLFNSIDSIKIDHICNWITECIISGYTLEIMDKLLLYYSNHIHINNPNLPYYLYINLLNFTNVINKYNIKEKNNILLLRNEQYIRHLLPCISILLSISNKTKKYKKPNKIKQEEFKIENVHKKLKASMNILPSNFIKLNEPDELKIITNEIYFNLKDKINGYSNSIYWISWILEWEKYNKKYGSWSIETKEISNIKEKYKSDIIWILWNLILLEVTNRNDVQIKKQIISLYHIYKHNYSISQKYKRLPYLYNSVLYLTTSINFKIPIITNYHTIIKSQLSIYTYFKSKKLYEKYNDQLNKKEKKINHTSKKENELTKKEICSNKLSIFNDLDPI